MSLKAISRTNNIRQSMLEKEHIQANILNRSAEELQQERKTNPNDKSNGTRRTRRTDEETWNSTFNDNEEREMSMN